MHLKSHNSVVFVQWNVLPPSTNHLLQLHGSLLSMPSSLNSNLGQMVYGLFVNPNELILKGYVDIMDEEKNDAEATKKMRHMETYLLSMVDAEQGLW